MKIKISHSNEVQWNHLNVKSTMPPGLEKLQEIAFNLWWVWNYDAVKLFREVDPEMWRASGHNPVLMLETVTYHRLEELIANERFMSQLNELYGEMTAYLSEPHRSDLPSVGYFSMEYGLSDILKIYSGGLGVLAGDYLKEASDCNIDLTAVGFLYKNGYFTQELNLEGQQIARYEAQNYSMLPLKPVMDANDQHLALELNLAGETVWCNIWKVAVGRVELYLLDTDHPQNSERNRQISAELYGGDWENRLKQEFILGVGGIQLLNLLGISKQVYHCNEGHAALINAERLANLIAKESLSFQEALEVIRASSLYTVHTPVPAGHDQFEEDLFAKYMSGFPTRLGISWADFMDLGRENPGSHEKFSMSVFACNCSQEVNGVSWLHGKVSQEMFNPIWKGYFPEELHVNYVTNGVHMPTWTASEWQKLYRRTFGPEWWGDQSNARHWEKINQVPDEEIWETRQVLKQKLIEYIRDKYQESWLRNQGDPSRVLAVLEKMTTTPLIIGFGRRFATYKRAHLLFTNLERLSRIVNNPDYPVQFVFTGKAHPADGGGQALIKYIVEISKRPEFQGKIIFLENYDMALARRLVSGVDIWLNTPTRPLEASGTSGQKAEMNGVLNFSVLDGWWLEGYEKGAGWALTDKQTYENTDFQDQLDAATIYSMLENEIIPLYFNKNEKGYSPEWIRYIKNSIARIAPRFTTKRMLDDYLNKFYIKLTQRSEQLLANNFSKAREIVAWKNQIAEAWDKIEVEINESPDFHSARVQVGEMYPARIILRNVPAGDHIALELVINSVNPNGQRLIRTVNLELIESHDGVMVFELQYRLSRAGNFSYAVRMYPNHPDLPHRQDFCYVRWIK